MAVDSPQDIQVFTGTMDGDTELRLIREGDYLYLKNARVAVTNAQNV